jgi:single-strand DNA-binding protein
MSGVNKVILVGNLGKDPEVRYLEGGIAVAKVTLATNESRKNKEGVKVDNVEWHTVNFWRTEAESAEKLLKKGMMIYVEGKIKSRSWMDKDGVKRHSTDIEGDRFTILNSRKDEYGNHSEQNKVADVVSPVAEEATPTDDLPF